MIKDYYEWPQIRVVQQLIIIKKIIITKKKYNILPPMKI